MKLSAISIFAAMHSMALAPRSRQMPISSPNRVKDASKDSDRIAAAEEKRARKAARNLRVRT